MTTEHRCNLNDPWPTGHPLPPEDPAKLVGFPVGTMVIYHRVRRTGQWDAEAGETVWTEDVADLPALVLRQSYVWSPGECRHRGGYRHYDWTVIRVFEPSRAYEVVVDDKDLRVS